MLVVSVGPIDDSNRAKLIKRLEPNDSNKISNYFMPTNVTDDNDKLDYNLADNASGDCDDALHLRKK